jgi:hypothetical protein
MKEATMRKLFDLISVRLLGFGSAKAATNGVIGLGEEDEARPFA